MAFLNIPEIGDKFVLKSDWTFNLFYEARNRELLEAFGYNYDYRYTTIYSSNPRNEQVVIPAGTEMQLDRIYIRKGKEEFSSLSWYIENSPNQSINPDLKVKGFKKGRKRFWATLDDCNLIEYV